MPSPQVFDSHPYYPQDAAVLGYVANETALHVILLKFSCKVGAVVLASLVLSRKLNPGLRLGDLLLISWFALSGYLHCFFEGYFILNSRALAGSQSLFAQLWKEYALSDSRYLTSDTFVLCIETITVFIWGPICLATAFCIARDSSLRYPLQLIASLAHLYGVALYYGTSSIDLFTRGVAHSRPEFLYFWVYYVGMNLPWAVIPAAIVFGTVHKICRVFDAVNRMDPSLLSAGGEAVKKSQ